MQAKFKVYDTMDVNPGRNWKSRAADTQVYSPIQGNEHLGQGHKI